MFLNIGFVGQCVYIMTPGCLNQNVIFFPFLLNAIKKANFFGVNQTCIGKKGVNIRFLTLQNFPDQDLENKRKSEFLSRLCPEIFSIQCIVQSILK
jgi:hypothetical protein